MWNPNFTKGQKNLTLEDKEKWQNAAQKKLMQTASAPAAEKYANHISKAAMQRRLKKQQEFPKGPLGG